MSDMKRMMKHIFKWYMTEKFLFFGSFISVIVIFLVGTLLPIFYKRVIDISLNPAMSKAVKSDEMMQVFLIVACLMIFNTIIWRVYDYLSTFFVIKIKLQISQSAFLQVLYR